jgi:hypothetical protein
MQSAVLAIAVVLTEAPPIRRGAGPVMVAAARTSDRPTIWSDSIVRSPP